MAVNDFLQFCPTDTGTNLLSESDYLASADRTSGNKPGVASSKLNNRALRQANYITSQLAQLVANTTGADVVDDATPAKFLAQLTALIAPLTPEYTKYTSGTGTHNLTYVFFIALGNATAGATYTNNTITFTVKSTVASGLQLRASGSGAPSFSGTLIKTSGTGDATITFYAFRAPLYLSVKLSGPGGGGAGGGTGATAGANGSASGTTFGTSLLSAACGSGGNLGTGAGAPGFGGVASITLPATGYSVSGGYGYGVENFNVTALGAPGTHGGNGGANPFGGNGAGGVSQANANVSASNCGAGGGGGGGSVTIPGGNGGGAGGWLDAVIPGTFAASYAYIVGTGGAGGAAGASGGTGAGGSDGVILVSENFQ